MKKKKIIKVITCIISIITILASIVISTFADAISHDGMDDNPILPTTVDKWLKDASIQYEYKVFNVEDPTAYNIFTVTRELNKPTTKYDIALGLINNGMQSYNELFKDQRLQYEETQKITLSADAIKNKSTDILDEQIELTKIKLIMEDVYITKSDYESNKFPSFEFYIPNGITYTTAISRLQNSFNVTARYTEYDGESQSTENPRIKWSQRVLTHTHWEIETNWNAKTRIATLKVKPTELPNNIMRIERNYNIEGETKVTYDKTDIAKFDAIIVNFDTTGKGVPIGVLRTGMFLDYSGNQYANIGQNISPPIVSYYEAYNNNNLTITSYENQVLNKMDTKSVTIKEEIAINGFTQWLTDVIDPVMQFNIGGIKIIEIIGIFIAIAIFIIVLKVFAGG